MVLWNPWTVGLFGFECACSLGLREFKTYNSIYWWALWIWWVFPDCVSNRKNASAFTTRKTTYTCTCLCFCRHVNCMREKGQHIHSTCKDWKVKWSAAHCLTVLHIVTTFITNVLLQYSSSIGIACSTSLWPLWHFI